MALLREVTDPATVVILGASGDLTRRKLVPSLHSLSCEGLLAPATRVVGVARSPHSDETFRDYIYDGVVEHARLEPGLCELWPQFAGRITYLPGAYDDPTTYHRLGEYLARLEAEHGLPGNRLFYLAIPPVLYPLVVEQLGHAGLQRNPTGWTRIIIEKPFGHDLLSAQQLNAQVHAVFGEEQVYRIDHYLGKETVQNLLVLRFANSIFEPLWNRTYVDHVQISMAENIGVEHRAGYYEQAGVLRDMLQSHLLQLLTLMALEPPATLNAQALRDEKVKVLHAVRPFRPSAGVWGQYQGYRQQPGVAADSQTPTYIALKLYVDNWRWQGVPFYLRSGKCLGSKRTEITLHFKQVPHLFFPEMLPAMSEEAAASPLAVNQLCIIIQPDEGIHLHFQVKVPGAGMRAVAAELSFQYATHFGAHVLPDAYERLLLDALQGDASLFARNDEIELAWGLVDPLTATRVQPALYAPGSAGPAEADTLMARDGRAWTV